MTTLAKGRELMLAAYHESSDVVFRRRMIAQILAITTGANPYFVWESLPTEQQVCFGSIEYHPQGTELCLEQWTNTGAAAAWSDTYTDVR